MLTKERQGRVAAPKFTFPKVDEDQRVIEAVTRLTTVSNKLQELQVKLRELERKAADEQSRSELENVAVRVLHSESDVASQRIDYRPDLERLWEEKRILELAERLGKSELRTVRQTVGVEIVRNAFPG